jgi:hypothetical protein
MEVDQCGGAHTYDYVCLKTFSVLNLKEDVNF